MRRGLVFNHYSDGWDNFFKGYGWVIVAIVGPPFATGIARAALLPPNILSSHLMTMQKMVIMMLWNMR